MDFIFLMQIIHNPYMYQHRLPRYTFEESNVIKRGRAIAILVKHITSVGIESVGLLRVITARLLSLVTLGSMGR